MTNPLHVSISMYLSDGADGGGYTTSVPIKMRTLSLTTSLAATAEVTAELGSVEMMGEVPVRRINICII